MTATMTAPPIEQVAPHIVTRIKDGDLKTAQLALLGGGVLLLVISAIFGIAGEDHARFYFAYLTAYMGVLSLCLGGLFFTMLHHITRAGWSVAVRRVAENLTAALPVMLLLFLPIIVGFDDLYGHWANAPRDPAAPHYDPVLAGKYGYLNKPFFFIRVAVYFATWIGLGTYFRRASLQQDENGDPALSLRMARLAAPGIVLFGLTLTFAAFDWIMSLDPHWFSTIFGVCYFAGSFMAFLAFVILLALWLGKKGYLREAINVEHYHDLGKLLFTFMVFWTYVNFSQYMLIWYANLPEETSFFMHRKQGGWSAVGTLLVVGHFMIPFAFLMSRHIKRNFGTLAAGAAFMLLVHWLDMQYLILPNAALGHEAGHGAQALTDGGNPLFGHFGHNLGVWFGGLSLHDPLCFLGMLGLITGVTLMHVRRNNLLPTRDPRLAEALHFLNQ